MMLIRRSDLLAIVILCFAFNIGSVTAVPCNSDSWIEVPSAGVLNPILDSGAVNASDCQARCFNTNGCYGVAWNQSAAINSRCYYNYNAINSPNSGINYFRQNTSVTYFALIRGYPNCNYGDYNCTFTWKGQKDIHGFSGTDGNRSNLYDCIALCQESPNCSGVDWNQQDSSCWINSNSPVVTGNQPNITFFLKNCSNALPATTKASTPGPSTTATSTTTTTTTTLPTTTTTTTTSTTTTTTTTTTLPTTSTATTVTTTGPPTKNMPGNIEDPSNMAVQGAFANYPQAIKPAYIVLAGLGGGCILLVITAIVILCLYPLNRDKYSTNSTATTVHAQQAYVADNSYVDSQEPERIDMDDLAESDTKTYYNAEEAD